MLPTIEVLIPMFLVPMGLVAAFVIWTLNAPGNKETRDIDRKIRHRHG